MISKKEPVEKRNPKLFLIWLWLLPALVLCLTGCSRAKIDLDARIKRVTNNLLPTIGIVVKGRPLPSATLLERMAAYRVPGVSIAVINNFEIEWAGAFGVKQSDGEDPVTTKTLFQAASISKPVAAAAALHFADRGEFDLDVDVNQLLKKWHIPENEFTLEKKVTLAGILSHTAGLTVHGFPGYNQKSDRPTLVQILNGEKPANTAAIRVDKQPGSSWRYSGGGYTVMQQMLIDLRNQSFPQILREVVLDPLGMSDSTYEQPLQVERASQAASAHYGSGKTIPGKWHTYPEMAAAGLWTTPSDLCRFAIEIMKAYRGESARIFSGEMARRMLTVIDGNDGLGLSIRGSGNQVRFSHGGSNAGFKCGLYAWTGSGQGVAIMTNGDQGSSLAQELLFSLGKEYGWKDFLPEEKDVISVNEELLASYVGSYRTGRVLTVKILVEDGRLYAEKLFAIPGGMQRVELFPESEVKFFAITTRASVTFQMDDTGRVTGLELVQNNRKRLAPRIEE